MESSWVETKEKWFREDVIASIDKSEFHRICQEKFGRGTSQAILVQQNGDKVVCIIAKERRILKIAAIDFGIKEKDGELIDREGKRYRRYDGSKGYCQSMIEIKEWL